MRRIVVPALALALLPFAAASPAGADVDSPFIPITPTSGPAVLTFTLPTDIPMAHLEVRSGNPSGTLVFRGPSAPAAAGERTFRWNGRTTAGARVEEGPFYAELAEDDGMYRNVEPTTQPIWVDLVPPRAKSAPRVSTRSVYPVRDGFLDSIKITSQTTATDAVNTDVAATSSLQVLDKHGTVVWSSAAHNPRWHGRSSNGSRLPAGTYRIRSRFRDALGAVGYSPTRAITLSTKRVRTYKATFVLKPQRHLIAKQVGRCGKIVKPGRRGKGWRGSLSLSSNHRCTSRDPHGLVYAAFSAKVRGVISYRSVRVKVVGIGREKNALNNDAHGFGVLKDGGQTTSWKDLLPRYATKTIVDRSKKRSVAQYVHEDGWFDWGLSTWIGRYDVKAFRVSVRYYAPVGTRRAVLGRKAHPALDGPPDFFGATVK